VAKRRRSVDPSVVGGARGYEQEGEDKPATTAQSIQRTPPAA
jgi:hypothetical protein